MCPPHSDNLDYTRNFLSDNDFRFPQRKRHGPKCRCEAGTSAYASQAVAYVKAESEVTVDVHTLVWDADDIDDTFGADPVEQHV